MWYVFTTNEMHFYLGAKYPDALLYIGRHLTSREILNLVRLWNPFCIPNVKRLRYENTVKFYFKLMSN